MTSSNAAEPPVDPALPPPPTGAVGRRRHGRRIVVGLAMLIVGAMGAPFFVLVAALAVNPCGAFGDHCTDYGQTTNGAVVFILVAALAALVAIAGVVLILVSLLSRSR
jgi:hypothetical protein